MLAHNGCSGLFHRGVFDIAFNGFHKSVAVAVKVQGVFTDCVKYRGENVQHYKRVNKTILKSAEISEQKHHYSRHNGVKQLTEIVLRRGHRLGEHKERSEHYHSAEKLVAERVERAAADSREQRRANAVCQQEKHRRAPVDCFSHNKENAAGNDYKNVRRTHGPRRTAKQQVKHIIFRHGADGKAVRRTCCRLFGVFAENAKGAEHRRIPVHKLGPAQRHGGKAHRRGVKQVIARSAEGKLYHQNCHCAGGKNNMVRHIRRHKQRNYQSGDSRGKVADIRALF